MAIEFDSSTDKVTFSGLSIPIPADISVSLWYNADTAGFTTLNTFMAIYPNDSSPTLSVAYGTGGQAGLNFQYVYTPITDYGAWRYTTSTLGDWKHAVITYNNSGTANNPTFYINSGTVALTRDSAPTSTSPSDTFTELYLSSQMDGKLQDVRIYNRILSADEVAELYNSRMQNKILNGLVFWSRLDGAKGLTLYDGATLAAGNTFIDEIGGAIGVPSGSPIGRGNVIQRVK